jgi:secreted trypsin-like serine protease
VVRATGIAQGGHVIAVGYGKSVDGAAAGTKLERDHVKVLETTDDEFFVGEATCQGDSGGPALDEATGEIVGVVSRGGQECDGPGAHNVYTRADAYRMLIDDALNRGDLSTWKKRDGGATKKPPTDVGAACEHGSECAAGVCVAEGGRRYCSRSCDASDHCPTHFRCQVAENGSSVCVEH